ncbi:dihydroorotate dehydrogenase electron transfer subunit [Salibacterium aidingense]|uniref:dihydroorotate dehydrogenase electron transfer subunit n=1 Tax=Salibacterium aidingense TaxID=384933 RepID=UPI00041344F5|nr:dihydroorotate dehydrogenase electron transfer subunit [Salibacterium aidingense]
MKQHLLPIISNVQVSSRYWHMKIDTTEMNETIEPGQFFHIRCSEGIFPFLRRPFSIYRINKEDDTIEFLYLVKGEGTKDLTRKKPGDTADLLGPLGYGFQLQPECDDILLTARGVGIATLAALAQEAGRKGVRCTAILSARSRDDLLAAETLQDFGAEVHKVTEEEGTSGVDSVESLMRDIINRKNIKALYTCGSRRLSRLNQRLAEEYKLPGEIALEEQMGCAMGACFACVCDLEEDGKQRSVRVCLEGPVFPLEKVVIS